MTRFLGIASLLLTVCSLHARTGPRVTPTQVQQYLSENAETWEERMPESGSCLFYTEDDWPVVLQQWHSNDDLSPTYREWVLNRADEITKKGIRKYETPEERMARTGEARYSAESESWQRGVGDRIFLVAVAAKLTDDPDQKKWLHDMVLEGCRYPQWGRSPHTFNSDLAAGHMLRAVALAWDWYPELFTADEKDFIRSVMTERGNYMLKGLYETAYWKNKYRENHNHVSINGLGLAGLAFYGDIPEAKEWLAAACVNFNNVAKYGNPDGSTEEGIPYWTYSMSFILQFIEGTRTVTDSADLYDSDFMRHSGDFRIGCSTPGFYGTLPWGDAPLRDYRGPQHILACLATEYYDASYQYAVEIIPFAPQPVGGSDVYAQLLMWYDPSVPAKASSELDYFAPDWDVVTTRSGWGAGDYMMTIKAGFTNRNHSHLDAGAIAFIFGEEWLLMAPGYGKGKAEKYYWDHKDKRWDYFSTSTESHCTLLINGKDQRYDYQARGTIDSFATSLSQQWTSIDLGEAYADTSNVRRHVLHIRDEYFLILDEVRSPDPVSVEWLAQVPDDVKVKDERLVLPSQAGEMTLQPLYPEHSLFALRQPTSLKVDKSNEHQITYALNEKGNRVDYVVLAETAFAGQTKAPGRTAEVIRTENGSMQVKLTASDVTDTFVAPIDGIMPAIAEATLGLQAAAAWTRQQGGTLTRLFAIDASEVDAKPLKITADTAVSLGLQYVPSFGWILDLNQDLDGQVIPADGLMLTDSEMQNIPVGQAVTIKAGRYYLTPTAEAAAGLKSWASQQFAPRTRPGITVSDWSQDELNDLAKHSTKDASVRWEAEQRLLTRNSVAKLQNKVGATNDNAIMNVALGGGSSEILKWPVFVEKAGFYTLSVRYCMGDGESEFNLLVDGEAPTKQCLGLKLKPTGGWSNKSNDWQTLTLTDENGQLLCIPLSAGEHTLEMNGPTGPFNLDWLELRGTKSALSK